MSFRNFLIFMGIVCVGAWIAWLVLIYAIDPTTTGRIGFFLFFLTLSVSLLSTLTLAGTCFRVWFYKDELIFKHVTRSLRQAFLLTALFVSCLFLAGRGLLVWWVLVLLVVIIAFLELVFLGSNEKSFKT